MKHYPYPGQFESSHSWNARCDAWEANRNRSNACHKAWTKGRPTRSGTVVGEFEAVVNGETVTAVRIGYGSKAASGVEHYARKHGLRSHCYIGNGQRGMYARYDAIAFA